jgi:hypothetical protein
MTESDSPTKGAMYSLLSLASGSKTYAAAMDKATQILPASLTSSLSSRARRKSSSPPPVLVAIRLQNGEDLYLPIQLSTSLSQLALLCAHEAGVPTSNFRLVIEEDRPTSPPSLVSAIRSTATSFTSRERVKDTLVDWVNFMFLPEAVNREVRGRGLVSWAREFIMPHLQPLPPNISQCTVHLLGERRGIVELSSTATISRLREAVERQTGLPIERQRIVMAQQAQHGPFLRLFWVVARQVYAIMLAVLGLVLSTARWIALGSESNHTMKLQLRTSGGGVCGGGGGPSASGKSNNKPIHLEVRKDITLAQLQHMVQLQHGDSVGLEGFILSTSNVDDCILQDGVGVGGVDGGVGTTTKMNDVANVPSDGSILSRDQK